MKSRAFAWKIMGTIVVLLMSWVLLMMSAGAQRLKRAKASIVAKGGSLNWRDVLAKAPGNGVNGEMDFLAAIDGLAKPPVGMFVQTYTAHSQRIPLSSCPPIPTEIVEHTRSGRTNRWTTHVWDEARPFIQMGADNWEFARRAATNDTIDLRLDWSLGMGLLLPHLQGQGYLHDWIRMAALHELYEGNRAEALDKVVTGFRLLEIHNEPILISAMAEHHYALMLSDVVWEIWATDGWSDAQLARLQAAVDSIEYQDTFDRAFQMEMCLGASEWSRLLREPSDLSSHLVVGPMWRVCFSNRDLAWYLENAQRQLEAFRAGYRARSLHAPALAPVKFSTAPPGQYLFSSMCTIAAGNAVEQALIAENRHELIVTAIALKRYRLKRGQYPEKLRELMPEFLSDAPVDWMDGNELRYERLSSETFRLWSVGTDGSDNGCDPVSTGSVTEMVPVHGRDWVWPQVSSPAAIEAFIKKREAEMKKAKKP